MSKTQSSAPIHINNRTIEHQTNGYVNENNIKVREYINPAIYVETTYKMNSCNQTIYFPGSGDHPKTVTVKRCACFTNPDDCPCHPRPPKEEISQAEAEGYGIPPKIDEPLSLTKMKEMLKDVNDAHGESGIGSISQISSSNSAYKLNSQSIFESDSGITVKATNSTSDLRLSIPSLTSIDTIRVTDNHTRGENYREWCRRKDCERKLQEERDQLIQKIKEQQKQAVLELERENFKRWLTNKKKKDEEARQLKLQQQEEARRKEEEKNKRLSEKERNYQIWLRKKEKDDLGGVFILAT